MKAQGIISDAEFQERKSELISGRRTMPCKSEPEAAEFIRKTVEHELISGVCWLVLALIQVCTCYGIFAGIWNICIAVSRFKAISRVKARDPGIPKKAENGLASLILLAFVNLILGGVIGIVLVGFDYFVRGRILENRHVFNGRIPSAANPFLEEDEMPEPDEVVPLVRRLADLYELGGLSDEEFQVLKHEILEPVM